MRKWESKCIAKNMNSAVSLIVHPLYHQGRDCRHEMVRDKVEQDWGCRGNWGDCTRGRLDLALRSGKTEGMGRSNYSLS